MAEPSNGNGGALTKGWLMGILLSVMLGLVSWIGVNLTEDVQQETETNNQQQLEIDRLKILYEVSDMRFREINAKLGLLLEERPRR